MGWGRPAGESGKFFRELAGGDKARKFLPQTLLVVRPSADRQEKAAGGDHPKERPDGPPVVRPACSILPIPRKYATPKVYDPQVQVLHPDVAPKLPHLLLSGTPDLHIGCPEIPIRVHLQSLSSSFCFSRMLFYPNAVL